MENADVARRRPGTQLAVGILVVLVTAALVGGLVWFRFSSHPPAHPAGQALGNLQMAAGLDFTCRLPVTAYTTAAMVSLPDGAVLADTSAPRSNPAKGTGPLSYDAQLARWLPVQRSWVSPDGRQYAFGTSTTGVPGAAPTGDLRVHDIATGKDRTLWQGEGMPQLLGWSGSTIVFGRQQFQAMMGPGPVAPEVWGVDASGGSPHRIGPNPAPAAGQPYYGGAALVGGGAAWSVAMRVPLPGSPASLPEGPSGINPKLAMGPGVVTRMDLRDGTLADWYTAPIGSNVTIGGIDSAGHPILTLYEMPAFTAKPPPDYRPPAPRVLLLTGRDQAVPLSSGGDSGPAPGSASADAHGIWFSGPGQIWLYRNGALKKVADVPAGIFPLPTPPPGFPGKPGVASGPGMASGAGITGGPAPVYVQVAGPCV